MYSGSTLTRYSGNIIGTHQKIDRVARNHLAKLLGTDDSFPSSKLIIYFEGREGPDGIKRKSPAQDEPWHYLDPFDESDTQLMELVQRHYDQLVTELRSGSDEHRAFEAAWLAHALVDGLTPAHHYPYEKELVELSGGMPISERTTFMKKIMMPGATTREKFSNNFKAWGPRGLRTAHAMFEMGVAAIVAPLTFAESIPSDEDIAAAKDLPAAQIFRNAAREIAVLDMYTSYCNKGWTPRLTSQVRHKLMPTIIQTVTLIWHKAAVEAASK